MSTNPMIPTTKQQIEAACKARWAKIEAMKHNSPHSPTDPLTHSPTGAPGTSPALTSPLPAPRSMLACSSLRLHPLFLHIPTDHDTVAAITTDLAPGGIGLLEAIKITADHQIVDGRHRWLAAKKAKLTAVPCEIVSADLAGEYITRSLTHRRHYEPGQRAYSLASVIPQAFEAARARMTAGVAADHPRNSVSRVISETKTVDEWAAEIGVSVQYLRLANELLTYFEDDTIRTITDRVEGVTEHDTTFRDFYEPRIMRSIKPYGLGRVKSGITGILDAEKHPGKNRGGAVTKEVEGQLDLFNRVINDTIVRWDYWQKFGDDARNAHWSAVRQRLAVLPADQNIAMADYHAKLAAEHRKAAKATPDS